MEQSSQAVAGPLDATVVPRWWRCDTHGEALQHNAWGCPECVGELREDNKQLRAFAAAVMADWPDYTGMDGGELQDLAVKYGLLRLKDPAPSKPCQADGCACAEYHGVDFNGDFDGPVDCYERTPVMLGPNVGAKLETTAAPK